MSKRYFVYTEFSRFQSDIKSYRELNGVLEKLAQELEKGRYNKFEKMGAASFYKFRSGNHRLLASREETEDAIVYILLANLQHNQTYDDSKKRLKYIEDRLRKFEEEREPYQAWLKEIIAIPEIEIPRPNDEEWPVLHQSDSMRENNKDIWVFEAETWVQGSKTDEYGDIRSSLLEAVMNLLYGYEYEYKGDVEVWEYERGNGDTIELVFYYSNKGDYGGKFLLIAANPGEEKEELIGLYKERIQKATKIDQLARRAYPDAILDNDSRWYAIQKDEEANLALSPEERRILGGVLYPDQEARFPLFINGRPGSGKSTILQYIYSVYFRSALQENRQLPLLLTYSEPLCKIARKNIEALLTLNSSLQIDGVDKKRIEKSLQKNVCSYRDYLRDLLPKEEADKLLESKYVGYSRFKKMLERRLQNKKYQEITAELCWHVIRTYIKGMGGTEGLFMPSDYELYPKDRKTVSDDSYQLIYQDIWENWYKDLQRDKGFWDDQDLTAKVLQLETENMPMVPAVFCDEAQDFTRQELEFIFNLSVFSQRKIEKYDLKNVPFIFAGDPFQTLNPTGFNWDVVKADFYEQIRDGLTRGDTNIPLVFNFQELQCNYRSAQKIVQFCNGIQLLRGHRLFQLELAPQEVYFRDSSPEPSYFTIDQAREPLQQKENQGINILLPCSEGAENEFWREDSELESLIGSVSKEEGKPVFSPMSAKGLEFPRIVLYKFGQYILEQEDLYNIFLGQSVELDKEKVLPASYFFNSLYVAASRAKKRVLIVDSPEAIENFWKKIFSENYLKNILEQYIDLHRDQQKVLWKFEEHLAGIHVGSEDDWGKDVEDLEQMAEQYFEKGYVSEDPQMLLKAERTFKNLGLTFQEEKAKAYRLFYSDSPDYLQAGKLFQNKGKEELQLALICFWKGNGFENILQLDPNEMRNKPAYEMAKFVQTTPSLKDCYALLKKITAWIQGDMSADFWSLKEDSAWKKVEEQIQKVIDINFEDETANTGYWGILEGYLRDLLKKDVLPLRMSFLKPAYQLKKYAYVSEHWENLPHKPNFSDYPEWVNTALVETTHYPKIVEYLFNLGKKKDIIRKYREYEQELRDFGGERERLSFEQAKIIADALFENQEYQETFDLLRNDNSSELAEYLLQLPIYSKGRNKTFSLFAVKKLFESYIHEGEYKKARNLCYRSQPNWKNQRTGFDVYSRSKLRHFVIRYITTVKHKDFPKMVNKKPLEKLLNQILKEENNYSLELKGLAYERVHPLEWMEQVVDFYQKNISDVRQQDRRYIHGRCAYILDRKLRVLEQRGTSPEIISAQKLQLERYLSKAGKNRAEISELNEVDYQQTPEYLKTGHYLKYLFYSVLPNEIEEVSQEEQEEKVEEIASKPKNQVQEEDSSTEISVGGERPKPEKRKTKRKASKKEAKDC